MKNGIWISMPCLSCLLSVLGGCTTSVTLRLNENQTISLANWAKSIHEVHVTQPSRQLFRHYGLLMIDTPQLAESSEDDFKKAAEDAIRRGGGKLGESGAPDLRLLVLRCSLVWDSTGFGITATATVEFDGSVIWPDGREERVFGSGISSRSSAGVIFPSSAEPMLAEALSTALARLLASRPLRHARSPGDDAPAPGESEEVGTGTCFAVHPDGWLVTAAHVVSPEGDLKLFMDGLSVSAEVVLIDHDNDLAILRCSIPTPDYLPLARAEKIKLGRAVYTLGFPLAGILTQDVRYTDGTISAKSGIEGKEGLFQISVPVQPGNSGGPLLTSDGVVIGVVVSRASDLAVLQNTGMLPENIAFAVRSSILNKLLVRAGIELPESEPISIDEAQSAVFLLTNK